MLECKEINKRELEGGYTIFKDGRIYSKNANRWIGTKSPDKGYKKVTLWINKKHTTRYIHRLVALAFISNPHRRLEINHKDGNKLNNQVGNLEWCTRSENQQHAHDTGLINVAKGEKSGMSKITDDQVREMRKRFKTKESNVSIAKRYGLDNSTVGYIRRGETWKHI